MEPSTNFFKFLNFSIKKYRIVLTNLYIHSFIIVVVLYCSINVADFFSSQKEFFLKERIKGRNQSGAEKEEKSGAGSGNTGQNAMIVLAYSVCWLQVAQRG